jgi:hypothetical protein
MPLLPEENFKLGHYPRNVPAENPARAPVVQSVALRRGATWAKRARTVAQPVKHSAQRHGTVL